MSPGSLSLHRIALIAAGLATIVALGAWWRAHVLQTRAHEALRVAEASRRGRAATDTVAHPGRHTHRTPHFTVDSSADADDTAMVGDAAEALYAAWHTFFADELRGRSEPAPLRLRLYGSRIQTT